jgi:E3 ubiquitin-protein ligase UBR4
MKTHPLSIPGFTHAARGAERRGLSLWRVLCGVVWISYCLESEPCLACSAPEVSYSQVKLSAVKAETKYTDNRILLRLIGTHSLQALTLTILSPRRSCMVRAT